MPSPPSWDTLADRAHKALSTVSTLTASIHIYGPRQNDPYGEPVESTVNVWFSGPGLWRIERNGELIVMRERARHLTKVSPGVMHGNSAGASRRLTNLVASVGPTGACSQRCPGSTSPQRHRQQ